MNLLLISEQIIQLSKLVVEMANAAIEDTVDLTQEKDTYEPMSRDETTKPKTPEPEYVELNNNKDDCIVGNSEPLWAKFGCPNELSLVKYDYLLDTCFDSKMDTLWRYPRKLLDFELRHTYGEGFLGSSDHLPRSEWILDPCTEDINRAYLGNQQHAPWIMICTNILCRAITYSNADTLGTLVNSRSALCRDCRNNSVAILCDGVTNMSYCEIVKPFRFVIGLPKCACGNKDCDTNKKRFNKCNRL